MGDYNNILNTAVEEAQLKGFATGMEKGMDEGVIAEITGLSLDEMESLK